MDVKTTFECLEGRCPFLSNVCSMILLQTYPANETGLNDDYYEVYDETEEPSNAD